MSSPPPPPPPPPHAHYPYQDPEDLPLSEHRVSADVSRKWDRIDEGITGPSEASAYPRKWSSTGDIEMHGTPSEGSARQQRLRRPYSTGNMGMQGAPQEHGVSVDIPRRSDQVDQEIIGMHGASSESEVRGSIEESPPPEITEHGPPPPYETHEGWQDIEDVFSEADIDIPSQPERGNMMLQPQHAIPGYLSIAFVVIMLFIGVVTGYETTVYGGVYNSTPFITDIFPRLRFIIDLSGEDNICQFYYWKTQLLNAIFHSMAVISIIFAEVTLFKIKRCSILIYLVVGSSLHALGSLASALANGEITIFLGRSCSGAGMGILMQSVPIILEFMGSHHYTAAAERANIIGLLLGPILANGINVLVDKKSPKAYWRLAFGLTGAISATLVVSLVILRRMVKRATVASDSWRYHGLSCPTNQDGPPLFIETVRTIITPAMDLNLYNHVILALVNVSTNVSYRISLGVSIWQSSWLGLWWLTISHLGVKIQSAAAFTMMICQIVTCVLLATQNLHSQISLPIGVAALIMQALFIVGYSFVSTPAGWIKYPLNDAMKRFMPLLSMLVQALVAYFTPSIVCRIGVPVFAVWGCLAFLVAAFLYKLVPNTWKATNKEMQVADFENHSIWTCLY